MTTIGSVAAAAYALYRVGAQGRGSVPAQALSRAHTSSAGSSWFQRYGLLVVVVPSILPPPMPFKIFVLLAGVADVRPVDVPRRGRHRPRVPVRRRSPARVLVRRAGDRASSARTCAVGLASGWRVGGRRGWRRLRAVAARYRTRSVEWAPRRGARALGRHSDLQRSAQSRAAPSRVHRRRSSAGAARTS